MEDLAESGFFPDEPTIAIDTLDELLEHEPELVDRIERVPNGGNLFMAHPFRLLADIGVELAEGARQEILALEPQLSALSEAPYEALRDNPEEQRIHFRVRGLFRGRNR